MGPTHRVDADSDSREYIPTADLPFFDPRSACRFTCVSALYRLCVSSFRPWDSPRIVIVSFGVVLQAKRSE